MRIFVCAAILSVACAAPGVLDNQIEHGVHNEHGTWDRMSRAMVACAGADDMTSCLAVKGVALLDQASRQQKIDVLPGVSLVGDSTEVGREGKALSEGDITSTLPADPQEKSARLLDLITEAASRFISSHRLEVKVPKEAAQGVARAIEEGRRGKMKKMLGPIIMAIGAKLVALVPLVLGGIAFLAVKALLVSKVAFILAAVLAVQKLFGGSSGYSSNILSKFAGAGNQGWSSYSPASSGGWASGNGQQGWSSGSSGSASYPYARSLDAQSLAYSGQQPSEEQ